MGISKKVITEEMIPLVDSVSKKTGASIIDLYTPMTGKAELVPDTIHPNADGAKILAETICRTIENAAQ